MLKFEENCAYNVFFKTAAFQVGLMMASSNLLWLLVPFSNVCRMGLFKYSSSVFHLGSENNVKLNNFK